MGLEIAPSSDELIHSLHMFLTVVGDFQSTKGTDKWKCAMTNDRDYHVDVLKSKLDNLEPAINEVIISWIHVVPIKVTTFI